MMKFVVNQLPYYGELCPLWTMCSKNAKEHECPRLRMLFAEKLQPAVQTVLNEKGKIEFHISIAADQEVFEELNERYKIMIS